MFWPHPVSATIFIFRLLIFLAQTCTSLMNHLHLYPDSVAGLNESYRSYFSYNEMPFYYVHGFLSLFLFVLSFYILEQNVLSFYIYCTFCLSLGILQVYDLYHQICSMKIFLLRLTHLTCSGNNCPLVRREILLHWLHSPYFLQFFYSFGNI